MADEGRRRASLESPEPSNGAHGPSRAGLHLAELQAAVPEVALYALPQDLGALSVEMERVHLDGLGARFLRPDCDKADLLVRPPVAQTIPLSLRLCCPSLDMLETGV